MSHRHHHKDEPPHTVKIHPESTDAAFAHEPAAETVRDQAAQSPEVSASPKDKPAVEKKTPSLDTVEELQAQLDQAKDRALRCQAELDNFRKRAARELDDHNRYASISLMRDLLPVLDNIYRAIEAAEKSTDGSGLLDGVKLVAQQLQGILESHHCKKIEALNAPFDPHLHHAILQQPSDDYPANTILTVTQDGYQLHDRVVRPSQVIVSTNSTK
jgi:molecular chaperone GrpE